MGTGPGECVEQGSLIGVTYHQRRNDPRWRDRVGISNCHFREFGRWQALLPGRLPGLLGLAPAKPGEPLLVCRLRHTRGRQTDAHHTDLGVVLERALIVLVGDAVGELPHAYMLIP